MKQYQYTAVPLPARDAAGNDLATTSHQRNHIRMPIWLFWLAMLCLLIGSISTACLLYLYHQVSQCLINEGFLNGFDTELGKINCGDPTLPGQALPADPNRNMTIGPAKSAIQPVQVRFTGGLYYDERGKPYRQIPEGFPQYVGEPTPEIDQAWAKLFDPRAPYLSLSPEESRTLKVETWKKEDLQSIVGLEVSHTLHCVNRIRKALYPEYYGSPESSVKIHIDHCIDHLRQFVQCHSDLTPLTFSWPNYPAGKIVAQWGALHTCRNHTTVVEWAARRAWGP